MAAVCDTQAAGSIGRTGSPSGTSCEVEETENDTANTQSVSKYCKHNMYQVRVHSGVEEIHLATGQCPGLHVDVL